MSTITKFLRVVSRVRTQDEDKAIDIRDSVLEALDQAGFRVRAEVSVGRIGPYRGFVDLVAELDGVRIGCEIDKASPRAKSIRKLLKGDFHHRVVLLRRGWAVNRADGILVRVLGFQAVPLSR